MDVAAYIKKLLYQEQFVYVPGLGTFLTRKAAGFYHQEQQRFYPPKNSIDFVAEEKQDETLENYISQEKNISPTAARYFVEKFVDQVKNDSISKNISVKEVLFPEEAETISATKTDASFNQKNFGLPPVHLSTIKTTAFPEPEPAAKPDYIDNFYKEFTTSNIAEQEVVKEKKSTGFWAGLFLLLLICVLGCYALYVYYPEILNPVLQKEKPAVTVVQKPAVDTLRQPAVTEIQPAKDTAITETVADTQPTIVSKPVAAAPKPAVKSTLVMADAGTDDPDLVDKSPYEIIGASFKTLKGAKAFLNQLKAKGMHRAKILKNTSGKPMVITFGSFKDKETAQAALEKLRAKDVHSEAYIQHYK
jgi:hypothetical protein